MFETLSDTYGVRIRYFPDLGRIYTLRVNVSKVGRIGFLLTPENFMDLSKNGTEVGIRSKLNCLNKKGLAYITNGEYLDLSPYDLRNIHNNLINEREKYDEGLKEFRQRENL